MDRVSVASNGTGGSQPGRASAQLLVQRFGESELSFVLQLPDDNNLVVLRAPTVLLPEQRELIRRQLSDFAECLAGFETNEQRLATLGKVLYRTLVPEPICLQLNRLRIPLALLTDDPSLPWEILHDGEKFLALRLPFARQLIINEQVSTFFPKPRRSRQPFRRALVVADPTTDLPGARDEGRALAKLFEDQGECDLLAGDDASCELVQGRLVEREYSVIHYCGHIDYDPTEHLASMRLADGLLSTEWAMRLFRGNPIVFLNACYSDLQPAGSEGGLSHRTESFARAFMMGNQNGVARAVIGTLWRIPDRSQEAGGTVFPTTFYQRLLGAGAALGEAFRDARLATHTQAQGPIFWGPYTLYGDPALVPFVSRDASPSSGVPAVEGEDKSEVDDSSRESSPLATDARQVLVAAQREMDKLDQNSLTSMHLMLGFCAVGIEPLASVLREASEVQETDVEEKLCDRLRQRAEELVPPSRSGFAISRGFHETLSYAIRRAQRPTSDQITAGDLLAGLLRWRRAEAVKALIHCGIDPALVARRLPEPATVDWRQWRFEPATKDVLREAERCAREAHLPFLGTPHLLIALIRTGQPMTIDLLRRHGLPLDALCEGLKQGVGRGKPSLERPETLEPSTRSHRILRRAGKLASDRADGAISEADLLRALLQDHEGFTAGLLGRLGAKTETLLAGLSPAGDPDPPPPSQLGEVTDD